MKRTNDILVGAVVIVVIAALIATVLWVQQADVGRGRTKVVARFLDVGNAHVGNAAVIRGVRGGRIDAIELASDGWVHVRMVLDPSVRLPSDPVVLLNESSLFGEWQATIAERSSIPSDETVRRQIAIASGGDDVLPGATLPGIAKLTAVAGQIAGDVASVAERVQVAFDESAARELRGSIRNFADLSGTLNQTVNDHASDIDTLTSQLRVAVQSLQRTALSTQRMAERVDSSATSGEVRVILDDVAQAARELRRSATQIAELSSRLGASQGRLDAFLANGDSVLTKINGGRGTLGLLVNDPGFYRNGDSLLVELRALVADVRANPRRYVNVRLF